MFDEESQLISEEREARRARKREARERKDILVETCVSLLRAGVDSGVTEGIVAAAKHSLVKTAINQTVKSALMIGAPVTVAVEVGILGGRTLWDATVAKKDREEVLNNLKNNGIKSGCGMTGWAVGATMGTVICPGIGTVVGGFAGSFIGGLTGSVGLLIAQNSEERRSSST